MTADKRKPGRPVGTHDPARWVERLTIKLPKGGKDKLAKQAAVDGVSVSILVRRALGFE